VFGGTVDPNATIALTSQAAFADITPPEYQIARSAIRERSTVTGGGARSADFGSRHHGFYSDYFLAIDFSAPGI
jgi:hypothetical protein